jgi:predicted acylesterase/phospholipase RssA/CRP-like cAMP-binding protein
MDIGAFLSQLGPFRSLPRAELSQILPLVRTISLDAGGNLFEAEAPSDSLCIVASGTLRLISQTETGRLVLVAAGDIFSENPLRSAVPPAAVVAEEPSVILKIPISALGSLPDTGAAAATATLLLRLQLASIPMLRDLSDALFARLVANGELVTVKRGEVVMREGEVPDCLYFVTSGSLEVFRRQADDTITIIDFLSEGDCVGELALLLKDHRTASVRAWRDARLIRIPDHCFEEVFQQDAQLTLRLARTLGQRLKQTTIAAHRKASIKSIAIVFWRPDIVAAQFCDRLLDAFQRAGHRAAVLNAASFEAEAGASFQEERISAWLAREEGRHDYLLCRCGEDRPEWTRAAIRQADLVLFVCPNEEPTASETLPELEIARTTEARLELLMIRQSGVQPKHTREWLALAPFADHQHLMATDAADYDRLVRRITGKAWGLVLSGGGARGLAHIGVIRALREHGVPIDSIAGTSMGAIIGGQYASGRDPTEILEATRKVYASGGRSKDYTVPFVSLRTGDDTIVSLKTLFGDRRIEDLPIGYFCVSCNLTRAEPVIHDRGPLWMWTRVSCSIPGLLPPVPHHGDLLVDGAFLDNLPVDAMRARLAGRVAASDVSVAVDLTVDRDLDSEWSWSGLGQLSRRFRKQPRLPNIVQMLMRTTELSSIRDSRGTHNPADLYLKPPVDQFPMTAFDQIDRIVELGYEYTSRYLQSFSLGS